MTACGCHLIVEIGAWALCRYHTIVNGAAHDANDHDYRPLVRRLLEGVQL